MTSQSQLKWRCRRGIKEMDLLFETYLDKCYPTLSKAEQNNFAALLEESDLDIYDWIMGRNSPDKAAYSLLIKQLQSLKDS